MKRSDSAQVELLESLQTFNGCSRQQLRRLAKHLEDVRVPSGERIVNEGVAGYHAFILVEGLAVVTRCGHRLATIRPGSLFGEVALLDGGYRSATVTALVPSRLLVLDRRAFAALMQTASTVAQRVMRDLAGRLRHADGLLAGDRVN